MKKGWKQWISAVLVVVLLFSMPICTLAEESVVEWTYDNSILVTVLVDEATAFSPADFPEVDCSSIRITEKSQIEQDFLYEMILILQNCGDWEIDKAIDAIGQNKIVKSVQRNEKFANRDSKIFLSQSAIRLAVGETAEITISDVDLIENSLQNIGIAFSVDPATYNADLFKKNSFSEYGISRFWPNTEKKENILIEKPDDLEAKKSENGIYYGLVSASESYVDTLHALAQLPGILSVSMIQMAVPGGEPYYENWITSKPDIVDLTLSGGETVPGFGENGSRINQTATIKGLAPGVLTLSVERGGFGAHASSDCTVIVYQSGGLDNPGDLDRDGVVNASDALLVLQHSVDLIALTQEGQQRADMDNNNIIDAADALTILQISVGLLA